MDKTMLYMKRKKGGTTAWILMIVFLWRFGCFGKVFLQLVYWFGGSILLVASIISAVSAVAVASETGGNANSTAELVGSLLMWGWFAYAVWWVAMIFTFNSAIHKYNLRMADEIGLNKEERIAVGLQKQDISAA